MSEARAQILSRLRKGRTEEIEIGVDSSFPAYQWSNEKRVAGFIERMEAVRAEIRHANQTNFLDVIAKICAEKKLGNLVVGKKDLVSDIRRKAGMPEVIEYTAEIESWKDQLFDEVDASLTTTRCGIAETGTLVLWPDKDEPRMMSLVPPCHIAILSIDRLYNTFDEVVEKEKWREGMPTNALLISGPSKSADIEQTLAYGVHGPKELVVVMVEG